jgi:protein-disulfide isomerase
MSEPSSQKISVPLAIIVAGGLIALAVFMSNSAKTTPANQVGEQIEQEPILSEVKMKPLTALDGIRGNPNAPITLVEFSDLECPFCKTFHRTMTQAMDVHGKAGTLAWVYKHFPLEELHPKAIKEAEATECAREQGGTEVFWKYVDRIFEITPSNNQLESSKLATIAKELGLDTAKFQTCLDSGKYEEKVKGHYQEALDAGGRGTPFSVFILKNPLSKAQENAIEMLQKEVPPDVLYISTDKLKVVMGGAMPYGVVDKVIKALTL